MFIVRILNSYFCQIISIMINHDSLQVHLLLVTIYNMMISQEYIKHCLFYAYIFYGEHVVITLSIHPTWCQRNSSSRTLSSIPSPSWNINSGMNQRTVSAVCGNPERILKRIGNGWSTFIETIARNVSIGHGCPNFSTFVTK